MSNKHEKLSQNAENSNTGDEVKVGGDKMEG